MTSQAVLEAVAREQATAAASPVKRWRSLRDILANPDALKPPTPIVPRLAWQARVTLLAAREKDGKSTLATSGAAAVTMGFRFLDDSCPLGTVLWVAVEEHPHDLAARADTFHVNPDRLYVLGQGDRPVETLQAAVEELKPVLVVIDTLATWAVDLVSDPGDSTQWTPVMASLSQIARDSNAAILLLHHSRKSDGGYRDSTAIGAGVDAILEMAASTEDPNVRTLKARGRWAMQGFGVRYTGDGFQLHGGELTLETRIVLHIKQSPGMSKRALRDKVGGRAKEVDAALETLLTRNVVVDRGDDRGSQFYVADDPTVSQPKIWDTVRDTPPSVSTDRVPALSPNELALDTVASVSRFQTPSGNRDTVAESRACGKCRSPMHHLPGSTPDRGWVCLTCCPGAA